LNSDFFKIQKIIKLFLYIGNQEDLTEIVVQIIFILLLLDGVILKPLNCPLEGGRNKAKKLALVGADFMLFLCIF
jgi:hypothetical protein